MPASAWARRICCRPSPPPAAPPASARCSISPPRSSCTASCRRCERKRRSPSRKHCAVPRPGLAYIAKTVPHNGRDLEGALNRLLAHNKLTGHAVTLEMAEREVRDLIRPQEPKRVKIEDIQRVVARQYNVSRSDLLSSRRTANVVRPRQ